MAKTAGAGHAEGRMRVVMLKVYMRSAGAWGWQKRILISRGRT